MEARCRAITGAKFAPVGSRLDVGNHSEQATQTFSEAFSAEVGIEGSAKWRRVACTHTGPMFEERVPATDRVSPRAPIFSPAPVSIY